MTTLRVELTDKCNLSCKHCLNGDSKYGDMPLDVLESVVDFADSLKSKGLKQILLTGGEISIYPHLEKAIELFGQRNIQVELYTNGVFAEQNSMKRQAMQLEGKELSNLLVTSMKGILSHQLFVEFDKNVVEFLEGAAIEGENLTNDPQFHELGKEFIVETTNSYMTGCNFYDWILKLQKPMQNGENTIYSVGIGMDKWHDEERKRLYLTKHSIFLEILLKELESKLKIDIDNSEGQFPTYVGRLADAHGFCNENPFEKIKPKSFLLNKDSEYVTKDRKELLELLYKNNFKFPKDKRFANDLACIVGMYSCPQIETRLVFKPNGDLHFCGTCVLPPAFNRTESGYCENSEGKTLEKLFLKNEGGPLDVARHYGIPEKEIYDILMDKGPCGLCHTAVNYRNETVKGKSGE